MQAALTPFDADFKPRFVAGLAFSLIAHLVLALAIAGQGVDLRPRSSVVSSLPPPTPEEPFIRAGIEQSRAVTIAWLGFESPTDHQATPSELDQAALSPREAGNPVLLESQAAALDVPVEFLPEPPSKEVVAIAPEPSESAAPEAAGAEPQPEIEPPQPPLLALRTQAPELPSSPLLTIVKRSPDLGGAPEQAAPAAPAPSQAGQKPGDVPDSLPSEKESMPTSTGDPVEWSPGRPLAAQGLDITTVLPRWTIKTRLSAIPANPVARIEFGKDGRVRKADFLPGQSTGFLDVDGPLKDAIYRWTAKGPPLEALPADDPQATVSFRVRIILMPSRGTVHRPTIGR